MAPWPISQVGAHAATEIGCDDGDAFAGEVQPARLRCGSHGEISATRPSRYSSSPWHNGVACRRVGQATRRARLDAKSLSTPTTDTASIATLSERSLKGIHDITSESICYRIPRFGPRRRRPTCSTRTELAGTPGHLRRSAEPGFDPPPDEAVTPPCRSPTASDRSSCLPAFAAPAQSLPIGCPDRSVKQSDSHGISTESRGGEPSTPLDRGCIARRHRAGGNGRPERCDHRADFS